MEHLLVQDQQIFCSENKSENDFKPLEFVLKLCFTPCNVDP
jgi:hypothetical protein